MYDTFYHQLPSSLHDTQVAFEVIAPSIPGYAFSSAPTKMGFNAKVRCIFCCKCCLVADKWLFFSAKTHFRKLLWFLILWWRGLDTKSSSLRWSFSPADDFSNENKTKRWKGRWLGLFHHSQFGDAFPGESCRSSSQSSSCESQSLWTISRSPSTSRHVIFTIMSQCHFLSFYLLHISFHNDNQGDLACILLISLPSS